MAVDIVFETHSISVDNERGVATGWFDGALSEEGRRLAAGLGERRRGVDVVFVSDLGRALETAEIAFGGTDIPVHADARLRECNYGELNGMPVAQLDAERSQRIDVPYPGGESYRDCVDRVRSCTMRRSTASRDTRLAAVSLLASNSLRSSPLRAVFHYPIG